MALHQPQEVNFGIWIEEYFVNSYCTKGSVYGSTGNKNNKNKTNNCSCRCKMKGELNFPLYSSVN
jgi:hypothetical protein